MKRFFKIISLFCLILLCFNLVACGDNIKEDRFYEQTNITFNAFISEVCLSEDYKNGIKYGNNVTKVLNKIDSQEYTNKKLSVYTELVDTYDKIFVSSFYFLSAFDGVFLIAPKDPTENMKKDYQNFEKTVNNTKQNILNFSSKVDNLDRNIVTTSEDNCVNNISLQFLREYKRELIDLCLNIIDLNNEFVSILENYIYPKYTSVRTQDGFMDLTPTDLSNQKTIAGLKSVVDTITPAIKYLNAFDGDYVKLADDNIFVSLDGYINLDFSKENTTTVEELDLFLNTYEAYKNDLICFEDSLEKVDFKAFRIRYEFNKEEFIKQNPENYAYITKIFNFTKNYVKQLLSVNKMLCE